LAKQRLSERLSDGFLRTILHKFSRSQSDPKKERGAVPVINLHRFLRWSSSFLLLLLPRPIIIINTMLFVTVFALALLSASSASSLHGGRRRLEEAVDLTWLVGYTMKFEQCFTDADGNDLAYFSFCPETSKCASGCKDGTEYVADMVTFVDAFTEAQLGAKEYMCEMVRENCAEGEDEDTCYANAGINCEERDKDDMNVQEFLECKKFDKNGYYVGPYCHEGKIYLGYFADQECSEPAAEGYFYETYGYALAFSVESGASVVDDTCASCLEHRNQQDNKNEDQADGDDVLEQCEELHTASQPWSEVSAMYSGLIKDVRAKSNKSQIILGVTVAVLASILLLGCMWYYMGSTNEKKKALLSAE
jgi:hypothetical protein